jgi:ABC-type glycerol-3-phosphate transport system permease component
MNAMRGPDRLRALLAVLVAIPFLVPFAWLLLSVLKPRDQFLAAPPTLLPNPPTLSSILEVVGVLETPRLFANSIVIATLTVLFTVASSALVAFAFAAIPARGRRVLFALLIGTILIPPAAVIVPQFILFSRLGWVGTYLPLLVPHLFASAFYVFLLRQWFLGLPPHLFEAAQVDGATPWQTFRHVALPLAKPALAAVAVFAFIGAWNDFLNPLVYLRSPDSFTVSLGMATLDGIYVHDPQRSVAMAVIALVPPVLVYLVAQRFVVGGIGRAGWHA